MRKIFFGTFVSIILGLALGCISYAYSDIDQNSPNAEAINYVTKLGIAKGYPDGSFHPDGLVTRAEFLKMVLEAKFQGKFSTENKPGDCFSDVKNEDWFASYVCYAKDQKIVNGYKDGSFKPNQSVNIAEASKIILQTLGSAPTTSNGTNWYSPFIESLSSDAYIPSTIKYINQNLKRREVAEMIWRILEKIHNLPTTAANALENNSCQILPEKIPSNVNINKVRTTWLGWYNGVRKQLGLNAYTYNLQLDRTAVLWSEHAKLNGFISHKRPGQTAYYDYEIIKDWFKNLGLEFENVNRVTFTENIGWGYYHCTSDDCTQDVIDAVRTTFDFFMSEKGETYKPHYDSIVNPYFKEIGLGIALDPNTHKYYLTVHYATAITSNPEPICE